jgi:hypothetical protein
MPESQRLPKDRTGEKAGQTHHGHLPSAKESVKFRSRNRATIERQYRRL